MSASTYLREARRRAKSEGYDPKKVVFAEDGVHKLSYDGVKFGRVGYGDHIIWQSKERKGVVPKGTAQSKRERFRKSHLAIKGKWRDDPKSPNWLAIRVLW